MTALLTDNLPLLAGAPNGIKKLRELILELAVRGKLVPQDPNDEPASELLKRIAEGKARLVDGGKSKKQKPLAAIGNEEKPFELPMSWQWSSLAQVALVNPRNTAADALEVSFVPMTLIGTRFDDQHAQEPRLWGEVKQGFTHFAEGDIGVAKITPCFENSKACVFSNLTNGLGAGTTELHIVRPVTGTLDARYVLAYLKSPQFLLVGETKMTGTAGQKRLPKDFVETNPFPLPPLAEQHRIVTKVDELMALCDRLEARQADAGSAHAQLVQALLDSLTQATDAADFSTSWQRLAEHFHTLFTTESSIDALKQTLLQLAVMGKLVPQDASDESASELLARIELQNQLTVTSSKSKKPKQEIEAASNIALFELPTGWAIARVAQTGEIKLGRQRSPKDHFGEHMVPYLRVANVKENALDLSDVKEMNFTPAEQEIFRLLPGDVLLNEGQSKELVGRPAIFNGEIPGACFQNTLLRFRAYDCVTPIYALRYFQSCMHSGRFQQAAQQTTNIAHLSASRLAAIEFPLPPVPEQHRIVAKVDQLMALCDQLKARINQAHQVHEHLANALVEQAVA